MGQLPAIEKLVITVGALRFYCPIRYLRASKWNLATAKRRLEETLKWRREYGFYDGTLSPESVEPEVSFDFILLCF